MARSRTAMNLERDDQPIRGAALAPLRMVQRKLVSPSGDVVVVDVPVYPPFRLASEDDRRAARLTDVNGADPQAAAADAEPEPDGQVDSPETDA